jgi:transglutaminase-like putative cysteine protease
MPVFQIHHITKYQYDRPVKESVSQIRVYPITNKSQEVRRFELSVTNDPYIEVFTDYYGNQVGDFSSLLPHQMLSVDARITVETFVKADAQPTDTSVPTAVPPLIVKDIQLLRMQEPEQIKEQWVIENILSELKLDDKSIADTAWLCSEFIYKNFSYVKGITSVDTTVDEILHHRSGVCQDFAHVLLQMLRSKGVPARYVSGYICPNKSGMRGEGATHAWVEVWMPLNGWVGIDPTNNVWVNGQHVVLATGRDFNDCTPVKGAFKGIAKQTLSVFVSIGYEDGNVFEDVNQVKLVELADDALEPWQNDWMQAQQQQQ